MKYLKKQLSGLRLTTQIALATLATIFVVAGIASATTIGTNISTDGSLTVTGTTTIDSGLFYVDVTNDRVGIGLTNPDSQFHVYDANGGMIEVSDGGSTRVKISATSTGGYIGTSNNNSFGVRTNNIDQIFILDTTGGSNAMVGIGTTTPTAKLTIQGVAGQSILNIASSSGSSILSINQNGYVGINDPSSIYQFHVDGGSYGAIVGSTDGVGYSGVVGYGNDGPGVHGQSGGSSGTGVSGQGQTGVYGVGPNNDSIGVRGVSHGVNGIGGKFEASSGYALITTDGNVGIGTATPQYKLDVNGDVNIADNQSYRINGDVILHSSSTADSLYVGEHVGLNNTTGQDNTFIGSLAGTNNTTGSNNTFIGRSSGNLNNSGIGNTFVGLNSGSMNTGANNNTFLGYNSGISSIGANNTFLGMGAGWLNTTGNNNTFLGDEAGGTNRTGSNNILIGHSAYGLSSSTSDYLNIGDVIYGDLSLDKIGIGTSTPEANLQVYGGDSATSTLEVGGSMSSNGACIKLRDSDGAGWSYCTILDGTLSCSQTSCE